MDVIMPQLGETVEEGTVAAWHKKEGDAVAVDELLVDIETDKVATEVPALVAGIVRKILVAKGETVKVGTTLAIIESDGEAGSTEQMTGTAGGSGKLGAASGGSGDPEPGVSPSVAKGAGSAVVSTPPAAAPASNDSAPAAAAANTFATRATRNGHGTPLSPAVRRLVAEHALDLAQIQGTGRDGRIKRGDVLSHLQAPPPKPTTRGSTEIVAFSTLRKRIAEHMARSKSTSAHVLQAVEVDFSHVETVRQALKKVWKEREGISLTYLPFIARAVALALPEFPHLNAHVAEDSLSVFKNINLSLAVDLDRGGLVAPVLKNVASLRVPELARAITKIAEKARGNTLRPDDMTEGSYSLTNNGSFGTYLTAPIINQPQVAILSIDGVQRKPWVVDDEGGERIEVRPVGVLAHSFDHRAVDGAYSGAYLRLLKKILESRDWIGEFLT